MVEQVVSAQRPVAPKPWTKFEPLDELCRERWTSPDAMAWHMPTLWRLAKECFFCVEFGLRRANSTVALLAGCQGAVCSWDLNISYAPDLYARIRGAAEGRWLAIEGNSAEAKFDSCDLLLHDSMHNYDHVKAELDAHGHKVHKYIVLHDTVACGEVGQFPGSFKQKAGIKGMQPAIDEFLAANQEWRVMLHDKASQGLMVLARS